MQVLLVDGDGKADFSIRVDSADALTADDVFAPSSTQPTTTDAFAPQHALVEALMPHDIAALI